MVNGDGRQMQHGLGVVLGAVLCSVPITGPVRARSMSGVATETVLVGLLFE